MMTPAEFVAKWKPVDLSERAASQSHFNDLCELVGHPKPLEVDKTGESFCFEKGAAKHGGGDGWADVWKKDFFGWEYKGKRKDLEAAYDQLLKYREALDSPPLLVVCDMDRIVVHTNFGRSKAQTFDIPLAELDTPRNLEILRFVFHDPDKLKPGEPSCAITEVAAAHLGELAGLMGKRGLEPHAVAHYLIRLVFCMFAEDVELLPRGLFGDIVNKGRNDPTRFSRMVAQLFGAMAAGGEFGADVIKHFNGNLFADAAVLDLTRDEIERVAAAAALEWNTVDASIFGTLFTRGIDPQQRSQLGAQYTGRADIETIVEPVVMMPLRREWAEVRAKADALLATDTKPQSSRPNTPSDRRSDGVMECRSNGNNSPSFQPPKTPLLHHSITPSRKSRAAAEKLLTAFLERLKRIRVLDGAGGSGNFLYVTLQKLLDLEKEVNDYLAAHGFTPLFPHVNPNQLFLIEINTYAHSLAQVTVQIGYIQWLRAHGYGFPAEPILMRLDKNFLLADALFTDWPEADFIVSNPPFLGNKQMRSELGAEYAGKIWQLFGDRIPAMSDLCCYWFEKARQHIADGKCKAAGLLATTGIKQVGSRHVLERIKESGTVFFAVSDREWTLEGASVRVSLIGFAGKNWGQKPSLDGKEVSQINADLTSGIDLTSKRALASNLSRCFMGTTKVGDFDIEEATALTMLQAANPHGKPNSDVLRPFRNGSDLVRAPSHRWIIDFGVKTPMEEAALYEVPFEYLRTHVKPQREHNGRASYRERWWIHGEARPGFRHAVTALGRYIGTPRVALHRVFVWLDTAVLPDSKVIAIAYDDDFYFGVLQSRAHEIWTVATCGWHGVGNDVTYNPTTCFETFPFPGESRTGVPPVPSSTNGQAGRPTHLALEHVAAITVAAKELNDLRERWLNPPEWTREEVLEFPASADGPWARYVECGGLTPPSSAGGSTPAMAGQAPPIQSAVKPAHSKVGVARYPRLVPRDADCAAKLKKRTLTNLYNERPTWLANAHTKLDAAVFAAYGWPADLSDDDLLARLLKLNLERTQ